MEWRSASRHGQSLVEFALILPLLLLLTLGIVDTARLFTATVALSNGVREAALYASEPPNFSDTTMIRSRLLETADVLEPGRTAVAAPACNNGTCDDTSETVQISASYDMDLFFPFVQDILGRPVTLRSTATAPIIDHSE